MLTIMLALALVYFTIIPRRLRWTAILLFPSLAAAAPLVDPTTDPLDAWQQVVATFQQHHWIGIAVAAYFALELAVKKIPSLAKLDDGRITIVLAAVVGIGGAGLEVEIAGGTIQAVVMAVVAAVFAYVHPAAADVAKKQATAA